MRYQGTRNAGRHGMRFLDCPDCRSLMTLNVVEGKRVYLCINRPKCRGKHSAHPDGSPLGVEVSREVRRLRWYAHRLAEQAWDLTYKRGRDEMYAWLGKRLYRSHFGEMVEADLKQAIILIEERLRAQGLPCLQDAPEGPSGHLTHDGLCFAYNRAVESLERFWRRTQRAL